MSQPARTKSRLSVFIRGNVEPILKEWEAFARSLPMGGEMDVVALRDHAREMLEVIATDLETAQTPKQQDEKARGEADAPAADPEDTAAEHHGAGRAGSGFDVGQMVSEFRALRASVIRLWSRELQTANLADLEDLTRFNESIDQAIAESITRFTTDVGESKERFLAILGHDLRNPLGAIITSSTFMLDTGDLREPALTLVERISSSARRMNQMVLDLLDYTRTRFGDSIPVVRAPTDVRKVVNDVMSEVSATYPDVHLRLETSGDLHGQWDPARLTQALINLVANAVQHGSAGSPVNIAARGHESDIEVAVQNRGPVIPKGQVGQLFQAMKHARDGGARDRRHLGLGLYIVDRIVHAHGGSIDVQSSEAEGTTFTVRLPRASGGHRAVDATSAR